MASTEIICYYRKRRLNMQETTALYNSSLAAYNRLAPAYGLKDGVEVINEDLARSFVAMLPPYGRVLDLGCGPGQYSRYFASQGYDVEAVDNSPAMIEELHRRGASTKVTTRCLDMRQLDYKGNFVGVFALASLIHLRQEDLPAVLASIRAALVPGGAFLANFAISDQGLRFERLTATDYAQSGRFFQHYKTIDIPRRMLEEAGFRIDRIDIRIVRPMLNDGTRGYTEWANFMGVRVAD